MFEHCLSGEKLDDQLELNRVRYGSVCTDDLNKLNKLILISTGNLVTYSMVTDVM